MTYDGFETFVSGIGNDDYDEMMIPFFFCLIYTSLSYDLCSPFPHCHRFVLDGLEVVMLLCIGNTAAKIAIP